MGRREKRAVESNLVVVLMHLLKDWFQPEKRTSSGQSTLFEHRRRLRKALADSPSLKRHLENELTEGYGDARVRAGIETELPLEIFPSEPYFTLAEALDADYLPA